MTKEEIKEQLIFSILEYEKVETTDLNEKVDKVEKCEYAAIIVEEYEDVICSKKENIMCLAYQQLKVFKRFNEKEKFIGMVREFKAKNSTLIFKINIVKLIEKYTELMESSVPQNFLKTCFKSMKEICENENSSEFK